MTTSPVIVEPELCYLPFACECGEARASRESLELHKVLSCPLERPRPFELPGGLGIRDGGLKF
jgi:hypothetical protein